MTIGALTTDRAVSAFWRLLSIGAIVGLSHEALFPFSTDKYGYVHSVLDPRGGMQVTALCVPIRPNTSPESRQCGNIL